MSGTARYPLRDTWLHGVRRIPFVAFVEDALPAATCEALLARIEAESPAPAPISVAGGEVMNTRVRNNERVMFDDAALAAELFAATRAWLPAELAGPATARGREGSAVTALFYLNDGFAGGETRLIDYEVTIAPKRGALFLFEHAMLHEGCEVTAGTKYVLRSDAMYWFASGEPE